MYLQRRVERPPNPIHPRTFYTPRPPLQINGAVLPKAPLLVVARAFGYLPTENQTVNAVMLRFPTLNREKTQRWLHVNLVATMPSERLVGFRGWCGRCTSNVLGHPLKSHAQEDCFIPKAVCRQFVACNTRSFCKECRGRSDAHIRCNPYGDPCRKCAERGLPAQAHQSWMGLCGIPNERVFTELSAIRRRQYVAISNASRRRPLEVACYNDTPKREKAPFYDHLRGAPYYVDEAGDIPEPDYQPNAVFRGLIPAHHTDDRLEIDAELDELALDFFLNHRQMATEEERRQIDRYLEQQRLVEQQEMANRPPQADQQIQAVQQPLENQPIPGGGIAQAIRPPVYQMPPVQESPEVFPLETPLVVRRLAEIPKGPLTNAPGAQIGRLFNQLLLTSSAKEEFDYLQRSGQAQPHMADLRHLAMSRNFDKVWVMGRLDEERMTYLKRDAKDAMRRTIAQALPTGEFGQQSFFVNIANLRYHLELASSRGDPSEIIQGVGYALLGPQENYTPMRQHEWVDPVYKINWQTMYAELLMRVGTLLSMTDYPSELLQTRMTESFTELEIVEHTMPIVLPAPRLFVRSPPELKTPFYNAWFSILAQQLLF